MSDAARRARGLMARPGAWLDAKGDSYVLRTGPDRRARILLTIDEATFRALAERPGLVVRSGGGWTARRGVGSDAAPPPGRPGFIDGARVVMAADGRHSAHRANLGESPIAWLARRKDQSGRPWLSPAEAAAGEQLRRDGEAAQSGASVTMRWDALPRAGSGAGSDAGPRDRALAARRRVEAALEAAGAARAMLERVCIHGGSLQLAEQGLGLRRRQGKTVLKAGLARLAVHYRIG